MTLQHKLALWAHLSHVANNSERHAVSVGEVLRGALGPRLYTIIPPGKAGLTFLLFIDVGDDVGFAPVRDANSASDKGDYFLDVRSGRSALPAQHDADRALRERIGITLANLSVLKRNARPPFLHPDARCAALT